MFSLRGSDRGDSGGDSRYDSRFVESPRGSPPTSKRASSGSPSRSFNRGNGTIPPLNADVRSLPQNLSPERQQQGPLLFSAPSPYSVSQNGQR